MDRNRVTIEGREAAGLRIEQELADRDWTQGDLAERSGVNPDTVSTLIRGLTVRPRPKTTRRIEDVFEWERGTIRAMFDGGPPPIRRNAPRQHQKRVRYHTRADARAAMPSLDEETFERVWAYLQGYWASQDQTESKGMESGGSQHNVEGV